MRLAGFLHFWRRHDGVSVETMALAGGRNLNRWRKRSSGLLQPPRGVFVSKGQCRNWRSTPVGSFRIQGQKEVAIND
jgi:hypothetical protein